uniref:WSN domain-containing protein n=1 Tax=Caenorhabditis tropicalis TaxID=1561998 RepID=A0A1I7UPA1_9PELO
MFLLFLSVTSIQCISESRRIPRASAKEFSETVNNLKYIATISSAISLEIGLIDGSISPYSAISDLLRMGSVKPEDMAGIDSKTINDALEKLEKLSENKPDEMIEKRFVDLEEMRIKESNEPSTISGLKEYQDALKAVEDLEGLKQSLTDIKKNLKTLETQFGSLKEADIDSASGFMITITNFLSKLESDAKSFDATLTRLYNVKKIQESSKALLNALSEENEKQTNAQQRSALTDENVASLLENFNKAFDVSKSVAASLPSFKSIRDLVSSRQPAFHHKFQYTSGLPSGPRDLASLKSNLQNRWVVDRISNHTVVIPNLEKAFSPFSSLADKLKSVESLWSSLTNKTVQKSINEVITTVQQFGEVSTLADGLPDAANQLKMCDALRNPKSFEKQLKSVQNVMETLNKEVKDISNFSYINQFKNLSSVKIHFNVKNLPDDKIQELASNIIKSLKTNSNKKIKTLEKNLKNLEKDVSSLLNTISNTTLITNVETQLDTLQKEMTSFSTCLIEINTKGIYSFSIAHFSSFTIYIYIAGQPVKHTIEALQKTRAFSIDPNTKSTIDSIVKSGGELAKLKTKAEDFKKIEDKAVKVLNGAFPESAVVSQKLGLGVQGLEAIGKALETKEKLNKLTEGLQKAQMGSLREAQQKAIQDSQKLPETFKSIDEFVTSLNGKKSAADFNSLRSIFEKASKVKGIDIDMKILREVAESLKLPFDDGLEALDLNFARFKIADSVPSLVAMDEFFMKYAEAMTKPKPADTPSSQNEPETATLNLIEKLELSLCFVLGFFVFLMIIVVLLMLKEWKDGKERRKEEERKQKREVERKRKEEEVAKKEKETNPDTNLENGTPSDVQNGPLWAFVAKCEKVVFVLRAVS